eukprot:NODE_4985_length_734_cov_58.400000_g4627_i0.p1 GENE.NODE_4985_length_734_cov_58.400000_g4627_i0~~NODE_4985_length_734_cov_58.400000_g4627_i0.p1  ORF type:complete len:143 (-),score=28.38 NODE_4985_length_734_cov_58.400000_g4627_i0:245-673(-)
MAVLTEKAKKFIDETVRNLWAYQDNYEKHKNLADFDRKSVEEPLARKRFLFRAAYPQTLPGRLRGVSSRVKYIFFGIAAWSLHRQDQMLRAANEGASFDRIQRKGYVRLPDGTLAQINPQIDTDLSPSGMWQTLKETLNPVP